MLQCVAVFCSVVQCGIEYCILLLLSDESCHMYYVLQCVAVCCRECCSVLQSVAESVAACCRAWYNMSCGCYQVMNRVTFIMYCSVLQCVAMCCSVLPTVMQCVAECVTIFHVVVIK